MKKYQMPNVKEVRLESSLFIMDENSPTPPTPPPPTPPSPFAPRAL